MTATVKAPAKRKAGKAAAAAGGRPALRRGKGAVLCVRVQDQLRARIEQRAQDQQCSLADVVAILLERGLRL